MNAPARTTWLSVAMSRAIDAWALRNPSEEATSRQIAAHAVAHGVSITGLRMALIRAGLIAAPVKREPAQQ